MCGLGLCSSKYVACRRSSKPDDFPRRRRVPCARGLNNLEKAPTIKAAISSRMRFYPGHQPLSTAGGFRLVSRVVMSELK